MKAADGGVFREVWVRYQLLNHILASGDHDIAPARSSRERAMLQQSFLACTCSAVSSGQGMRTSSLSFVDENCPPGKSACNDETVLRYT